METESIWVFPTKELADESWRLLLRQPSEQEIYEKKQQKILKEIFQW
jgi:hypothetical protein